MGSPRIHISVMMLNADVAACGVVGQCKFLSSAIMGNKRVQTIEERCGVDAGARLSLGKIPHLVKWPTLADRDYKADEEEHGVQDDRCLAEDLECPR